MRMLKTLLAVVALAASGQARAADLVVISAAAVRSATAELPARVKGAAGDEVRFIFGTAGGTFDRAVSGQPFDLVIAPPKQMAELAQLGLIVAGRGGPLGTVRLGVALKRGAAARPALASAEDFKNALLAAPSIGLADPSTGATTGIYFAKLLKELGVAEALQAKIKLYKDGNDAMEAVARGEVAIAAGQISEIKPVAGVELVGPLPEALQLKTVYAVGLSAKSAAPEAAAKLLEALVDPTSKAAFQANGFDTP